MRMAANENLGAISPNLYNAAKKANLSPTGEKILVNFTEAYTTGLNLNQMDYSVARKSFLQFGKDEQKQITNLWGERDYSKPDESNITRIKNIANKYLGPGLIVNTVRTASDAIYAYSRANTAAVTGAATSNPLGIKVPVISRDESVWTKDTWNKAYDGKEVYNQEEVQRVIEEYGPLKVKIAQDRIAGITFGETLFKNSLNGKVNQELIDVYNEIDKNDKEFGVLVDKVKLAQYSPGRNITNFLTASVPPENVDLDFNPFTKALLAVAGIDKADAYKILRIGKNTGSGSIDAGFLVFADPMTYLSLGLSPRARAAANAEKYFRNKNIPELFRLKQVRNGWDNVGPILETLSKTKDPAERAALRTKIGIKSDGRLQNAEIQDILIEAKAFNAKGAERFWTEDVHNVKILGSGSTEGISLWLNTVPFARSTRYSTNITNRLIEMTFNKSKYADDAIGYSLLNSKAENFLKLARDLGMKEDFAATGGIVSDIKDIEQNADKFMNRLRRNFQKSPQGMSVLYGKDANKSVETVKLLAQQLYTRSVAKVIAEMYPTLSVADQILTMRGIYASIMLKVGAEPKYIEEALEKTFTNKGNFTTFTNVDIPMGFDTILSPHIKGGITNGSKISVDGGLQPRQLADAIAPLDFQDLLQNASKTRAYGGSKLTTESGSYIKNNKKQFLTNIYQAMGRSKVANEINSWGVTSQLYPRLGLRSVPEELITLAWALPLRVMSEVATGRGRQYAEFLTTYSGSVSGVGPFFKTPYYKVRNELSDRLKKSTSIKITRRGPDAIPLTVRENYATVIAERKTNENIARAKKYGTTPKVVNPEDVTPAEIIEELFYEVQSIVQIKNPTDLKYLHDLIVNRPDVLGNFGSSLAATTGINGRVSAEAAQFIFPQDAAVKALAELGGRKTKEYKKVDPIKLAKQSPSQLTYIHKNAIDANFGGNNSTVLSNGNTFDPSITFFTHDGLRNEFNFTTAVDELLGKLDVSNLKSDVLLNYIEKYARTPKLRKDGLTDTEIATVYIQEILLDLRQTFHGGTGYNDDLFRAISQNYNDLVKNDPTRPGKWGAATKSIDQVEFAKLTENHLPATEINSVFDFEKISIKDQILKTPQVAMEQMDRIITAFVRQPVVTVLYMATRERYAVYEKALSKQQYDEALKNNPLLNEERLKLRTDKYAADFFTDISTTEAVNTLMKYVDNPGVQSNLAISGRFLSRYYRAGEDFIRRSTRILNDQGVEKLLRMRLLFQGLEPRGDVYEDANGEPYYVFPTDNIINNAINPVLDRFGLPQIYGDLDITTKLASLGPSLAVDANRPALSNVTGMLTVKTAQSLLGLFDQDLTDYLSVELDDLTLGTQGGQLTWAKTINFGIHGAVWEIFKLAALPEHSRLLNSTLISAISQDEAMGIGIPKFDTDEQNAEAEVIYLDNLNARVKSLLFWVILTSKVGPTSLQLQEGKQLSEADRLAGFKNIRPVLFDIYNGLMKSDPTLSPNAAYEQALAIFSKDNPGKTIFSISRDEKDTKILLAQTKEFRNWLLFNKSFTEKYKDTSYIFAPRSGNFDVNIYRDLESFGLVKDLKYKDYLYKIKTQQDKVKYYAIDVEKEKRLQQTASIATRKQIINEAEDKKAYLKAGNPYLKLALGGDAPGTADEEIMLQTLKEIVRDSRAPISETQKINMTYALDLVNNFISYARSSASRSSRSFSNDKKSKDYELRKSLKEIGLVDEAVREANRAIFTPILNNLTRYESTAGTGN